MQIFGEIGVLADDGEKVQCHLCGKWFLFLARHITSTHQMSCNEYKDEFDLRRSTKLSGPKRLAHYREINGEKFAQYAADPVIQQNNLIAKSGDNSPSKRPETRERIAHRVKKIMAEPERREKSSSTAIRNWSENRPKMMAAFSSRTLPKKHTALQKSARERLFSDPNFKARFIEWMKKGKQDKN